MATPKATEVKAGQGVGKEIYPKGLGGEAAVVDAPSPTEGFGGVHPDAGTGAPSKGRENANN